ncbi:alpha/beta hydrolase [Planctomicrobium sp. SH527]|uniref:alpha/beta hydrolase n=1 Tax=Planctomicrobium sp. SH527 TaxID=3448123 RepID=UPI003F5B8F3B
MADRKHRALAGLSMGAGLALNTGLTNSTEFAWVGAFSGSGTRRLSDRAKLDLALSVRQPQFLWLSVGDRDGLMRETMVDTGTFLTERRVPYVFCINAGGHEPKVWMNDLYYFAPRLFRK